MKLTAFIIALLCAASASAYNSKTTLLGKRLNIVPELGVNFTNFTEGNASTDLGFVGGLGIRIGKKKHIQTGIYFTSIRYAANFDSSQFAQNSVKSNYITIPGIFGITPVQIGMVQLRLQAGPVLHFNGTGEIKDVSSAQFNPTIWNARAAVGLSVWKIEATASYDIALTNTYSNVNSGKNRSINVMVGFRF